MHDAVEQVKTNLHSNILIKYTILTSELYASTSVQCRIHNGRSLHGLFIYPYLHDKKVYLQTRNTH